VKPEDPALLVRNIGLRIAELRLARGWTREKFAERLGISTQYLARLEAGHQNFTVHRLAWLASSLGVPVVDLFKAPRIEAIPVGRPRGSRTRRKS
jgi:transcriptional regulator with XRE-family HTH domain